MIREPNRTTELFTQNKQPWRLIVNGRTTFGESEQRSGEENKRTGQTVDRKRRQKPMQ